MTAVHQAVELALGTGVIGQSSAGLGPAIGASLALDGSWIAMARRGGPEPALSFLSGVAVGVPVVHFTLWPWHFRRGLPLLTEAEGLPRSVMPVYNAILYAWAGAGALALARETPRGHRRWFLAGLLAVAAIRPAAQRHFTWMAEEARRHPQWWNRAWG